MLSASTRNSEKSSIGMVERNGRPAVLSITQIQREQTLRNIGTVSVFIALLRAVNLGGHNRVAMADLRTMLEDLGLRDAQTLLQSGNAVFRGDRGDTDELERILERALAKRLGVRTDFMVRTAAEWRAAIAGNPFPREAERDPGRTVLFCLKDAPPPEAVTALQEAISGREVVRAKGRSAYAIFPDGMGRSRLTITLLEKKLGTRGTGRNWNTVLKLGELAQALRGDRPAG